MGKRIQIYYFALGLLNINKCLNCMQNNKYDSKLFLSGTDKMCLQSKPRLLNYILTCIL